MKHVIALILFWILTIPLLSWSIPASVAAATPRLEQLEQGRQLYEAGSYNQALAVLRNFIQQEPFTPETARGYALIARIFIARDNYVDALLYLQRIPEILHSPEIELLMGQCLVETNKFDAGLQRLRPLISEPLSTADRKTLFSALATASAARGDSLQALFFLHQQLPFTEQPATVLAQAHQLLQNKLSETDLSEAAFMWQGTAIGQDARLQLARRALVKQQPEQARQQLQRIFASSVTFPYWQEAEALLKRTSDDNWLSRDSIGVMLPLSGRYASYGELVKKGLELALQEHNKTSLPVRFIYRDTAATGVTPAQLVSALTDDDRVMAVIGPLLATTANEAARRAQQEMVPLLSLSQGEGLPEIGDFIFRDTLTADHQVKKLVAYAMATGHISFSVLHPQNRLGEQMTKLFVDEVHRAGGEIVDVIGYPEDSTDFKKPIEQLLWLDRQVPIPLQEGEEPPELEYPLPPFHALFIPDYADRISLIAPQLVFYGIKDVTLLGINGWNSADLAKRASRFLKDAVFVDAFFAESKRPEVKRFEELYRQAYGDDPSILEAQAFDVATILLQAMDDPTLNNRDDLRKKLLGLQNFQGVTGTYGFDSFGESLKNLYLLQFRNGRIVEKND